MEETSPLAYFAVKLVTTVKSFAAPAPGNVKEGANLAKNDKTLEVYDK